MQLLISASLPQGPRIIKLAMVFFHVGDIIADLYMFSVVEFFAFFYNRGKLTMSLLGALVLRATGAPSVKHPFVFVRFDSISSGNDQNVHKDIQVVHDFLEDGVHYLKPTPTVLLMNGAVIKVSREASDCICNPFASHDNVRIRAFGFLGKIID